MEAAAQCRKEKRSKAFAFIYIEMNKFNVVTFSSLEFIFRFLPFFLIAFYLAPSRYKKTVLFLAGLLFYALGAPVFLPLFLVLTGINCLFGRRLCRTFSAASWDEESREFLRKRKKWLFYIICFDAGVLILFKLLATASVQLPEGTFLSGLAGAGFPLGMSFYTFKMISYQADCYRGKIKLHGFLDAAVYFCLFPQLVSGPIMRFETAEKLFFRLGRKESDRKTVLRQNLKRLENGLYYFILGLGAKVLLADRLGILWHEIETIGFESISTPLAWMGAFAYSLQLYFDFAGYSLMAAGISVMIGLPFVRNFYHPYAAGSVREFFRRWHMTLGSWFRDYVYIPLGGNRKGMKRCILNLGVVWVLTGLWHGGSLNFLIWGLVLFGLIILEKLFFGAFLQKHRMIGRCYIVLLMPVTWMIFAITDSRQLGVYLGRMFPFMAGISGKAAGTVHTGDFLKYARMYALFFLAAVLFCIPGVCDWLEKRKKKPLMLLAVTVVFWASIYMVTNAVLNPFLYFSF